MSPRQGAWLLAAGRAALGAAVLASPSRVTGRWLGESHARTPVVRDLARSLGARDLGLGIAVLATLEDPVVGPRLQAACAVADAVDALATLGARNDLPRAGVIGTVLVAGGSAAAGVYFAQRLSRA